MSGEALSFPFRPWVRNTARRALWWGGAGLAAFVAVAWTLRGPDTAAFARALQVLAAYALLFWASLLKIEWTARRPAAVLDGEGLSFQPLHTFRPRRLRWAEVQSCGQKPATESLRLVVERGGQARELFLNLGLIDRRHEFLDALGEALVAAGLERLPGSGLEFQRSGWSEPGRSV